MASSKINEFQQQMRDLLRTQQDAYIAAVTQWRDAVAAATAAMPQSPPGSTPIDPMPTPAEMAEASYAFAAKLLADQSRFMDALSKALAAPSDKK